MASRNTTFRIFISSVQDEFAEERRRLKQWLTTDLFVSRFVDGVFIFEDVPSRGKPPQEVFLDEVKSSDIYIGLIGSQYYGKASGKRGVSATEQEYDAAATADLAALAKAGVVKRVGAGRGANLFGTKRPAITKHLANIYKSGELEREGTCSILEHMGNDGKQSYRTMFYNLDAILSVGYRVNSRNATLFRRWATQVLKAYLLKGYAVNARLAQLEDRVDRRLAKHDERIAALEEKVEFFVQTKEPPLQSIFYQNKFWDAKSLLIKFIRRAKEELIVIDAYPGVATGECCYCENVASCQFQFPIEEAA